VTADDAIDIIHAAATHSTVTAALKTLGAKPGVWDPEAWPRLRDTLGGFDDLTGSLARRLSLLGVEQPTLREMGTALCEAGLYQDAVELISELWRNTPYLVDISTRQYLIEGVANDVADAWLESVRESWRRRGCRHGCIRRKRPERTICNCGICRELRMVDSGTVSPRLQRCVGVHLGVVSKALSGSRDTILIRGGHPLSFIAFNSRNSKG
jgi:hypothetical protein